MKYNLRQFMKNKYIFTCLVITFSIFGFNYLLKKNETIHNSLVTKLYFDPQYYLEEYPDVKKVYLLLILCSIIYYMVEQKVE